MDMGRLWGWNFKAVSDDNLTVKSSSIGDDSKASDDSQLISRDLESNSSFRRGGRKRFITTDGKCALRKVNRVEKPYLYHMTDIVSSLLECRWRYILFWYTALNLISWYLFGVLWYLIAYAHEDLATSPHYDATRVPCVTEVKDMVNAFMFSIETQYTTGYGSRTPSTECPEAIFVLCVQNIVGMLMQGCSLGIIFAKLARPKKRTQAIKFSDKAVISMRDGYLCLMFRIADMRKSYVISCEVKGWVLRSRMTAEGEILAQYRHRLTLNIDDGGSDTFLVWPVTVVHRIDENSPLYDVSAEELYSSDFEIVVSLTCTIESTGQSVEAKRSYIPSEIHWGHRFKDIIRRTSGGGFHLDYNMLDKTVIVDTALCSAKALYHYRWSSPSRTASNTTGFSDDHTLDVCWQISEVDAMQTAEKKLLTSRSSIR